MRVADVLRVDLDAHVGVVRGPDFFNVGDDVFEEELFNATFHESCGNLARFVDELALDYRRADCFGAVDDFFDSRYALGDAHAGDTSEMEGLECHLRAGLADRLSSDSANRVARLDFGLSIFAEAQLDEFV